MAEQQQRLVRPSVDLADSAARERRSVAITGLVIGLTVLAGALLTAVMDEDPMGGAMTTEPIGVERFYYSGGEHVDGDVDYAENPPVGGPHASTGPGCGFFDAPVVEERVLHLLEQGAVWIVFRPDLPSASVERLREIARSYENVVVSPYADLSSPVMTIAWNRRLSLQSATEPRLEQFVRTFEGSSEAPALGTPCGDNTSAG